MFGPDIAIDVLILTHFSTHTYIQKIKDYCGIPLKVKLADVKHDMDLSRIKNPTEKDLSRMKQYQKAVETLL